MKLPTELHRKPLSSGLFIPPQKTVEEGIMGSYFFMRVAARRRRALATLMKKYEPMNLPSQFSVEVGLLW